MISGIVDLKIGHETEKDANDACSTENEVILVAPQERTGSFLKEADESPAGEDNVALTSSAAERNITTPELTTRKDNYITVVPETTQILRTATANVSVGAHLCCHE